MGTFANGFVWTSTATIILLACIVIAIIALVLFLLFGRNAPSTESEDPVYSGLEGFHLAVLGSMLRGKKDVAASEFIATLMALSHEGVVSIQYNGEGTGEALVIDDDKAKALENLIDSKALELLKDGFAEEDGSVYLSTAKRLGELNKDSIDSSYRAWKQIVKDEAAKNISVGETPVLVQKILLYAGYALIICAALASYFVSLMASLILLITGGMLLALSLVMQQNIFVEKKRIGKLYQWLDTLETHREEVPTDRASVQLLLEYACLLGIASKTGEALQNLKTSPAIEEEVVHLAFWKNLKTELYTTPEGADRLFTQTR
jgi:hypothetical protein